MGGALALVAAERSPSDVLVALWEPVLDTAAYLQELLRVNVSTQTMMYKKVVRNRTKLMEDIASGESVSINGYDLAAPFVDGLLRLEAPAHLSKLRDRSLLVRSGSSKQEGNGIEERLIPELPVFWKEPRRYHGSIPALVEATVPWLRARMNPHPGGPL